ncbi:MAG: hypothetical protein HKP09_01755, partial [Enterobacterales bacterium]|nr:hypothetical protein [Enterobacterales bacterium]
ILIVGVLLARKNWLTAQHVQWASSWIIYVSMPAIALLNIPGLAISPDLAITILSPLLTFALSAIIFYWLLGSHLNSLEKLIFTIICGLANTSFLGFPIISALYPQEAMRYAIVYDQVTFLVLVCAAYSMIMAHTSGFKVKTLLIKIVSFPAFIAVLVALALPIDFFSSHVKTVLYYLGATMSPLAVLVVGYYIAHYVKSLPSKRIILAAIFCLVVTPLMVWGLFMIWPADNLLIRNVTIMEAATPPMITSAILLMLHTGESRLTAQLLSWGSIGSIATIPLWYWLLQTF